MWNPFKLKDNSSYRVFSNPKPESYIAYEVYPKPRRVSRITYYIVRPCRRETMTYILF